MRRTDPKFYDKENDLVQCQECLKLFTALNTHIPRKHKMTCEDYKNKYFLLNGDLCCWRTRQKKSQAHKKPELLEKSMARLLKNVNPHKGKIPIITSKERYKTYNGLSVAREFAHTPEANKKLSNSLKIAHREGKMNIAYEHKKTGKLYNCIVCGKEYYRPKCQGLITKFCSKKCSANSEYTKNKIKEYWEDEGRTYRPFMEKIKRSIRLKKEWSTGKRVGGWHWSNKLKELNH